MTKSYVSMEQKVCIVCGTLYDTDALLLDKRLKDSMEQHTVTGYGVCPKHQKLADEGYVALVGALPPTSGDSVKPDDINRTGELVHIRKELFNKLFTITLDPSKVPMVVVDSELISKLKLMTQQVEGNVQ